MYFSDYLKLVAHEVCQIEMWVEYILKLAKGIVRAFFTYGRETNRYDSIVLRLA